MNIDLEGVITKYLKYFPNEKQQLNQLNDFIVKSKQRGESIFDSKNTIGHITASGYIYSLKDKKMLLLEHKKLSKLLQPGGHVEKTDKTILDTVEREIFEETGLKNLKLLGLDLDKNIPIDINTHFIPENFKKDMPCHYHHDFRYLFIVEQTSNIKIDENESNMYQWVSIEKLCDNEIFSNVIKKINKLLSKEQREKSFYNKIIDSFKIDLHEYECIIVTHIITGCENFLETINSVCKIKAIIPKPNSINNEILDRINKHYNIMHLKREDIGNNQQLLDIFINSNKKLIIFDIGGYFANIVNNSEVSKKIKCIIEDTENGYQKYEKSKSKVDIISVARSKLKDNEDYLVGQSILFSADVILRKLGKLINYMNCGVLGFGKIGYSIAMHLLQRGIKPMVYDCDSVRQIEAYNRNCNIKKKEDIIRDSDVLFLATGNHCLNINDFRKLKNGSVIFSVTSSDDEIDDTFLESEYKIEGIAEHIYKYENNYNFFYLIRKGNAVNFIHDAIMGDFISLVKAEMLVAANQYVIDNNSLDKSNKIWETSYKTKKQIGNCWLNTFFD